MAGAGPAVEGLGSTGATDEDLGLAAPAFFGLWFSSTSFQMTSVPCWRCQLAWSIRYCFAAAASFSGVVSNGTGL